MPQIELLDLLSLDFQFLLVFRKAAAGELAEDSGLSRLAALTDVDVAAVGVSGAATFFESKVSTSIRSTYMVALM